MLRREARKVSLTPDELQNTFNNFSIEDLYKLKHHQNEKFKYYCLMALHYMNQNGLWDVGIVTITIACTLYYQALEGGSYQGGNRNHYLSNWLIEILLTAQLQITKCGEQTSRENLS